jgi:hypothetical protein
VYESLGDIHRFNGNFPGAIDEYQRSLELREVVCEENDRLLAQAYYSLAVAHIYLAGETQQTEGGPSPVTPEAALSGKKTALRLYVKAKEVLMKAPTAQPTSTDSAAPEQPVELASTTTASADSSTPAVVASGPPAKAPLTEAEERKELCDEISETIAALEQEIKSVEEPSSFSSSSSATHNPAKLLGASTTTVGFGQSATSSTIPLLEVKRKTTPSTAPASAGPAAVVKRAKVETPSSAETSPRP